MVEIPTAKHYEYRPFQTQWYVEITNASWGERTVAGRQHNSLERSSISRYVWLARFWTLYVPGFRFPSAKMDIGSSGGETNMAAGNNATPELTYGSSTPFMCTRHAFLAQFREIRNELSGKRYSSIGSVRTVK